MIEHRALRFLSFFAWGVFVLLASRGAVAADDAAAPAWRAGVASVKITPEQPMWMAGYASRTKPSEGVAQHLYAKALAVSDADDRRIVIVTTDLIGIPRDLREALEQRCAKQFDLPPESLLLNASHTHCGPELRADKAAAYQLGADRIRQADEYLRTLEDQLVGLIGEALRQSEPARLFYCRARCGFAMNRRLPVDGGYRNSPYPEGPVDHDVPVLVVRSADDSLQALLFGYACHNTTLSFFQFCGDYAGFAQQHLQEDHPEATALFLMGCGGDQNPYPRGELKLAEQHGRALANAVEAALQTPQQELRGPLRAAMETVTLDFVAPPSREELVAQSEAGDKYARRHAALLLEQWDQTGRINIEYPYPVQAVAFGDDLLLIALAGETVVDYSLKLKRELAGRPVWVAGYSNDVFGYVPSLRVLQEGGYEAGGAFVYGGLPGPFAETVEQRILDAVGRVAGLVTNDR